MDHVLYWLDLSGWLAPFQHAWIWASVSAVLAVISFAGIVIVARRYDESAGASAHFDSSRFRREA